MKKYRKGEYPWRSDWRMKIGAMHVRRPCARCTELERMGWFKRKALLAAPSQCLDSSREGYLARSSVGTMRVSGSAIHRFLFKVVYLWTGDL